TRRFTRCAGVHLGDVLRDAVASKVARKWHTSLAATAGYEEVDDLTLSRAGSANEHDRELFAGELLDQRWHTRKQFVQLLAVAVRILQQGADRFELLRRASAEPNRCLKLYGRHHRRS